MSKDIRIKKGLDIKLKGEAEKVTENAISSNVFTLKPEDFHSIIPKLSIKVGTKLKAGESVFYNKANEEMKFPSPVSGEVLDIIRGDKRKILAVKIQADSEQQYVDFGIKNPKEMKADDIKSHLLAALLRANSIPAGLCYQRLTIEDEQPPFCLHGLNAIYLERYGWYRVDARGNKEGVCAEFCPPTEKLAFPVIIGGEADLPEIWGEPLPVVIEALERGKNYLDVAENLPDIELINANK